MTVTTPSASVAVVKKELIALAGFVVVGLFSRLSWATLEATEVRRMRVIFMLGVANVRLSAWGIVIAGIERLECKITIFNLALADIYVKAMTI
jgi:hypothetical protein